MQTVWYRDLKDPEEQARFKQLVLGSNKVLDKLHQIVYNMTKDSEFVKRVDYANPSWSHEQAHRNGRYEALQEILLILTLDKREQT